MYNGSVGLRLTDQEEEQVQAVMRQERWTRARTLRHLLRLGLASYKLDSEAASLLDALVGRLDTVCERLGASAGFAPDPLEVRRREAILYPRPAGGYAEATIKDFIETEKTMRLVDSMPSGWYGLPECWGPISPAELPDIPPKK